MTHVTPLDKGQFGGISFEHSHTSLVPISCDYCYYSNDNAKSYPHVMSIDSKIGQIQQELKSCEGSMDNMTRTLIDQFLELVKGHVKSNMPVPHDTDLRVGPTTPKGFLLGDFEYSYHLSSKSGVDTPLCDFEVMNDISSPSFAYASPLETSTSLDTFDDVLIIPNPSLTFASLGEIEEGDGFETDASLKISVAHKLSQRIPFLRSILLMSRLLGILVRLHLTWSSMIPFLLSLPLT